MPYASLPAARRMHYEIDGTVVGYNQTGNAGSGMTTVLSSASALALNEETPTAGNTSLFTVDGGGGDWIYFLFPETVDLSYCIMRVSSGSGYSVPSVQGSTDTTTGADGTWNDIGQGSGTILTNTTDDSWWRSTTPRAFTSNNSAITGFRINIKQNLSGGPLKNIQLWGTKHSGQTPDDIIFLESDGTTEWPTDDDWSDINAGASAVTHTYYVKNTSATKTANTITVKSSGSDNTKWTVSLDNSSFASSKSISSLAAGATQVVYFKFTPPSPASGVYRPYAAYLEADVTSWT